MSEGITEIDAKIAQHIQAIKSLRGQRNLLAPISRLPREILAYIFLFLSKEHPFSLAWISTTHICKLWRQIALDTPDLWTCINLSSRREIVETFLTRSKAAGLTVFTERHFHGERSIANYKLTQEHWSRLVDLEIEHLSGSDQSWQNSHNAITSEASRMRRLRLSYDIFDFRHLRTDVTNYISLDCSVLIRSAPSLMSLSLFGFHFSWSTCRVENLSELILNSIADSVKPSIVDILNILVLSPGLKVLVLDDVGPKDMPADSLFSVKLPNLQRLKLHHIQAGICMKLLQTMELAGSVNWDLDCLNYPILEPKLTFSNLSARLTCCDRLVILLGLNTIIIQSYVYEGRQVISRSIGTLGARLAIGWNIDIPYEDKFSTLFIALSSIISSCVWKEASEIEVRLHGSDNITNKDQWLELLHLFDRIDCLACVFEYSHYDADIEECLVEALMTTSAGLINFPELVRLELRCANFSERRGDLTQCLIDCLKLRKSNGSPLKKLLIDDGNGIYYEVVSVLKNHVDDVIWDEVEQSAYSEDEDEDEEFSDPLYDSDQDYDLEY